MLPLNCTRSHSCRSRPLVAALIAGGAVVCVVALLWGAREWDFFRHLSAAQIALADFAADDALLELTAAEKLKPRSAHLQYLLGVALRKAGHLDDCGPHLNKALELGWPANEIRFQSLLLAFQTGDRRAESAIKQIISLPMADDMAEDAYEAMAVGYLADYRIVDAGLATDRWLRLRPRRVRAMLLRAEVFGASGRIHEQLEQYEQVLAIEPDNYAAHLGKAHDLLEKRNVQRALEEYRWCAERRPGDVFPPLGMAACYKHQAELQKAAGVLRELLKGSLQRDERAHVTKELGNLLYQTGELSEAVLLLTESVGLNSYDEEAEYALAVSLVKIGKPEEAEWHNRRFMELEKLKLQVHDIKLVIFNQPSDAQPRYEAGLLLAKLGQPKTAAAMMLAALRCDPRHTGAHAELAKYYQEIGRNDLVREHKAAAAEVAGGVARVEGGGS
jgi:tetratricopeptide (TPR) repeat protein